LLDPRSRRDFLRLSGLTTVGGSFVFLAACGGDDEQEGAGAKASGPGARRDVGILNSALDLEHTAIAAYTAGAELLRGGALATARTFLQQEREHAQGLAQAIKELGGTPSRAKSPAEYRAGFPPLRSQRDVLEFAIELENMAVAAYVGAIPQLSDPRLRQTAAAINTNEAEHISVLLGALGRPQVPDAYVTGRTQRREGS
jgi:rubrerythrin